VAIFAAAFKDWIERIDLRLVSKRAAMNSTTATTRTDLLAYRSDRLAAVVLDGVLIGLAGWIATFAVGASSLGPKLSDSSIEYGVWSLFLVVQAYLLTTRGQTLGKIAFNVRIVRASDGGPARFVRAVLLRYVVPEFVFLALTWRSSTDVNGTSFELDWPMSWAAVVAVLLQFTDILFIFTADRRCLHDLLAGTKVIRALAPRTQSS
jgi:uncharacterized RDD family membrane protein YckC